MKLDAEQISNGLIVVRIKSDTLDASNVKVFRKTIEPILDANSKVVLDLEEMTFVDSSGLGALISSAQRMSGNNRQLVLCSVDAAVQALFDLMRLHKLFAVHATRDEALRGFVEPSSH